MSKITRIQDQIKSPDRVSVYIDNDFCCGIRKRTFQGMNLSLGDELTCEELKEKESFFWKKTYNEASWEKEKVRLNKIKDLIEENRPDLSVIVAGFGAGSTELIKEHPDEKGIPDLNIVKKDNLDKIILKIEVTGTEVMRGSGYWIRPDKLDYAANHPEEIIYTALHYSEPHETIRFLKHIHGKQYNYKEKEIKGAVEHYCEFYDEDEEILTIDEFFIEIKGL